MVNRVINCDIDAIRRQICNRQQLIAGIEKRLMRMAYKVSILYAPKRTGKSTALTMFTIWAKKLFNARIVTLANPVNFRPSFGRVYEITWDDFQDQIEKINELLKEKAIIAHHNTLQSPAEIIAFMEPICLKRGIIIYNSWIITDEMRKILGRRLSTSKKNRQMDNFFMQVAHYFITVIGTIPNWQELDDYALEQVDWKVDVSRDPYTEDITLKYRGKLDSGMMPWTWIFNGVKYRKYFNSYGLLGLETTLTDKERKLKEAMNDRNNYQRA